MCISNRFGARPVIEASDETFASAGQLASSAANPIVDLSDIGPAVQPEIHVVDVSREDGIILVHAFDDDAVGLDAFALWRRHRRVEREMGRCWLPVTAANGCKDATLGTCVL